MQYVIVRMKKFKGAGVAGIQMHNRREKVSQTNPDIDYTKSKNNYALVNCENFNKAISQRIRSLNQARTVRKDAVVMSDFIVSASPDFFKDTPIEIQRGYFRDALNFISNRYGKENIISAVVHLDEATPHMHIDMVPIINNKLCAKSLFTKKELSDLQGDFYKSVGIEYGLSRGEIKDEKRRHLETREYKIKAKEDELNNKAERLKQRIEKNESFPIIEPNEVIPIILNKTFWYTYQETPLQISERLNKKFSEYKNIYDTNIILSNKNKKLETDNKKLNDNIDNSFKIIKKLKEHIALYEDGLSFEQKDELLKKAREFKLQNEIIKERHRSRGR